MKKMKLIVPTIMILMVLMMIVPSSGITHGELDGEDHPFVGLMVADDADGNPLWRCTGTLLSPMLFLTAGHCTEAPAARATIWFATDVESGIPGNGYPFDGDVDGTTYSHELYNPSAFWLYDAGMVVLDEPVFMDDYGSLPQLGLFDSILPHQKHSTDFTPVGYGLQNSNSGINTQADRVRYAATVHIINIGANVENFGPESVLFTNNAKSGGTCFGDSGGPIFYEDTFTVAAVTSYGLNSECGGTGGGYRMDVASVQNWINSAFSDLL